MEKNEIQNPNNIMNLKAITIADINNQNNQNNKINKNDKNESVTHHHHSKNPNLNTNNIIKPKKKIKSEYSELKPNIVRAYNLRFIEPFTFKYQLYAKGRWVGKKLMDVLLNEFRRYDRNYFQTALKNKNLQINEAAVEEDYIIQRADFITHDTTRKENPIIDVKLDIVYDDEDFLAVDKPSSWPTHVSGGYFFNTMHRILTDEYGYKDLKILHRLDKHTSGVVIMAKNKIAAEKFCKKISKDHMEKNYYCRVRGDFPHESINVVRSIIYVNKSKGIFTDVDNDEDKDDSNNNKATDGVNKKEKIYYATDCDEEGKNTKKYKNKAGKKDKKKSKQQKYDKSGVLINKCDEDDENDDENSPKYAETYFQKVFYDKKSNTSLVLAKPKTGRTHQIRIHLRYLGYPIANDPCYGGIIYNDMKELQEYNTKGCLNSDLIKFQQFVPDKNESDTEKEDENEENINADENKNNETKSDNKPSENPSNTVTNLIESNTISVSEMYCYKIWLHSWKYKFDKYEFTTKIPEWAKEDYQIDYTF
jgi:23S rRNA-/tRNA-specific pseudouridylate synthase